jgi:hypothetical protein
MKSAKQAIENMEYVRGLLEHKQPGFAACLEFAASLVETSHGGRLRLRPPSCVVRQRGAVRPGRVPSSSQRTWSLRNFHQVTLGSGLDVGEVQKMEPMRAHEAICKSSLVHEWRVAHAAGSTYAAGRSCCRRRRLASGRRVGALRLPGPGLPCPSSNEERWRRRARAISGCDKPRRGEPHGLRGDVPDQPLRDPAASFDSELVLA